MSIIIWITPFIIFFMSSYWFNSKKMDVSSVSFKVSTILDTVIEYSFTMFFISKLVVTPMAVNIILIFVFLISGIIHFWHSKVRSNDFDLEIETIKNSLVVFSTTFIPFLILLYVFSNRVIWIQYPLSIIFSIAIFKLSIYIKKYVVKTKDKIAFNSQLVTDLTLTIIYYLTIVICVATLMTVFVFTKVSNANYVFRSEGEYTPAFSDVDNVFDWGNSEILDTTSQNYESILEGETQFTILLRDENNREYVVMFYYPRGLQEFSPYIISQELVGSTSSTLEAFDGTSKFIIDNNINFVTPSTGLYIYRPTGSEIVPGTAGYPVSIIQYDTLGTCFLIDHLDGTYEIINSLVGSITLIDDLTSDEELVVINSYLFIENEEEFIKYDDPSISFTKFPGVQQYNEAANLMFTSNRDFLGYTIIRESTTEVVEKHFYISEKYDVLPLLSGYINDPVKIYADVHKERLDNDLYIYSSELDQYDWLSLVVYNPDEYLVEQSNSYTSFIQITQFDSNRTYEIYNLKTFIVKNSSEVDEEDGLRIIALLTIISTFFVFIPITNYRTFTKVIDFESEVYNKK